MSSEIERRLAADARELDTARLSPEAARELDARLAMTRQVEAPAPRLHFPAWQAVAAAAVGFGIVAATVLLWQPMQRNDTAPAPVAGVTVPAPADRPAHQLPAPLQPVQVPLQRVSHAAPLEAEWVALREDLERARDQIERELPLRF